MRLIDADALLEQIDTERERLVKVGMLGAEHILVHYVRNFIENAPTIDRPQGEVDSVKLYEQAISDLENNKITLGEYEVRIEPLKHLYYDRPQGEWIDCKEPPSTDRNVFVAYGTDDMKSVCIGHYEHDMKLWYEDKNFFARPIFDVLYWCEIPQFPARMKGASR